MTQRPRAKPSGAPTGVTSGRPCAPEAAPAPGADTSREVATAVARAALARNARDVVVFDVRRLASYAEYVVVMTADSERQLGAVADSVVDDLAQRERYPFGVEGERGGRWVLVDYGDVVAHVFVSDARAFYDLEGLWSDAPRFDVSD